MEKSPPNDILYPESFQSHQFDISTATIYKNTEYGYLKLLSDKNIIAGEHVTRIFEYTAGTESLKQGSRIKIFTDSDSDWAIPQLNNPLGPDYLTIVSPDGCRIYPHIIDNRELNLFIASGTIKKGAKIRITLGDKSEGGLGSRCQTYFESSLNFYCGIDEDGTGNIKVIDNWVTLKVQGGEIANISLHAPSDVTIGQKFRLIIKAEDAWGNPAEDFYGDIKINAIGLNITDDIYQFKKSNRGVATISECEFFELGEQYITASTNLNGELVEFPSNPIEINETPPKVKLYWGDPHSGQIANPYKINEYFEYAKNISAIDYAGYQRNDSVHSTKAYLVQQESEKTHYVPHEFVVLPGYEWSADWEHGGHHNVYFSRFDLPIKRWNGASRIGEVGESDLPHVTDLHNYYRGTDTIITPHVGGQHADLKYHDPNLEPALEITSTHGTFEWFLEESLEKGYEMGFLGGNDCHTSRPGDDRPGHQPRRYSKGGLTGTYAEELTLPSILNAIKARRVYATTGAKIRAYMHVDDHFIGEEYQAYAPPQIDLKVAGTNPLEKIELFRGTELIHTSSYIKEFDPNSVRVIWSGASRRWSYSGIIWKGIIKITNGEIIDIEKIRFDSPRSNYELRNNSEIHFESWTCGYPSGLILNFTKDSNPNISLMIESQLISNERRFGEDVDLNQYTKSVIPRAGLNPEWKMTLADGDIVKLDTTLAEVKISDVEFPLGGLNRKISIQKTPKSDLKKTEVEYRDKHIKYGSNPYWAKITQQDMEMAWISPVFAKYYGK